MLVPLVAESLTLPSRALLQTKNQELEREIGKRKKSEARYRAIVEDQTELITRFKADGTLLFVNSAYCRYFGLNPEDLLGKPYEPVVYEADRAKVAQLLALISTENPVVSIENRVLVRGEVRWTQWTNRRLLDETGKFLEFQSVGRDITVLKQTEEQLRNLSDRLTLALKSGAIGTWEWDLKHEVNWDDGMYEIYGLQRFDHVATYDDWIGAVHPDDRSFTEAAVQSAIHGEKDYNLEFRIMRPDGSLRFIQASAIIRHNEQEVPQSMVGINYDITVRKQAEEQLQQTNKQLERVNAELARATRLKDEFLANISHELRTPLTSILGMSEVLKEKIYGELNNKQYQYIEIINQSGKHLLALINDILDLAKIESGKLELQVTSVSVQELCTSSLSFVKQNAHNKRIKLSTLIPPDVGEIEVDELRVRQALINLLSNAVKFTPEEGQVTLEVKRNSAQRIIQFSVTDTGIGIAVEDMPKLFQSFVQIDSSLSRQYGGTGLGLALVRRITELHQGSISVESILGKGSCFTITLPDCLMSHDVQIQVNSTQPVLQLGQMDCDTANHASAQFLILIAEDNQATIATLSAYLTAEGYRLLITTDGQEVISLAKAHQPDVILMDIQMPNINGLEVTRQIRSIPELSNTPIIALTALVISGDRERCLEAGVNEYLAKPVRFKYLVERIQQFCEQRQSA